MQRGPCITESLFILRCEIYVFIIYIFGTPFNLLGKCDSKFAICLLEIFAKYSKKNFFLGLRYLKLWKYASKMVSMLALIYIFWNKALALLCVKQQNVGERQSNLFFSVDFKSTYLPKGLYPLLSQEISISQRDAIFSHHKNALCFISGKTQYLCNTSKI